MGRTARFPAPMPSTPENGDRVLDVAEVDQHTPRTDSSGHVALSAQNSFRSVITTSASAHQPAHRSVSVLALRVPPKAASVECRLLLEARLFLAANGNRRKSSANEMRPSASAERSRCSAPMNAALVN